MSKRQRKSQRKNGKGFINILIWFIIICFAFILYSFAWIPAIIATLVFAIKKGPNKKRNLLISIAVGITSFLVFIFIDSSSVQLTSLQAEWSNSEYDIKETTEVILSPVPEDAKIETLSISDNSIATLKYKDGKAMVSFKADGSENIYFIANDKVKSNKKSIKVIDAKSELKAKEEKLAAEQEEAERIAQEQAEAERLAAEQAQLENQENTDKSSAQVQSQPQEPLVWIPQSGDKYHKKSDCGNMDPNTATQVTKSEAESRNYAPCGRCY